MQALLQRVSSAKVDVDDSTVGSIQSGLCVFLGVEPEDNEAIAEKLANRVIDYRIFPDGVKAMNRSLFDVKGQILIVSQFTLAANTKSGLRPSFSEACPPDRAKVLYESFVKFAQQRVETATGVFGANMQVSLTNDGPVTFLLKV